MPYKTPNTTARFLILDQVADELACSDAKVYALVRSGSLRAMKVGGRGQWRVSRDGIEAFKGQTYTDTQGFGRTHPWGVDANASTKGGHE